MEKRYQVFISSTFADLENERQAVMQALLQTNCIPAGMELFPALDEDQFEFIKRIIDDCDYYILIIAGRYGSLASDGISYTEKEYDYTISKGIKVIALIHKHPSSISSSKSETKVKSKKLLGKFRNRVSNGRLVSFWEDEKDLKFLVTQGLQTAIKLYPASGWIRSNQSLDISIVEEINHLRKENMAISQKLNLKNERDLFSKDLLGKGEIFSITVQLSWMYTDKKFSESIKISYEELFIVIAQPSLRASKIC